MNENALLNIEKFVKAAELRDHFNSIGAVVLVGYEHDVPSTPATDLPENTVEAADQIFKAQS